MRNPSHPRTARRVVAALLSAAAAGMLLLSACSPDGPGTAASSPPSPTLAATPAPTTATEPQPPALRLAVDTAGYEELTPGQEYAYEGLIHVSLQDFPRQTDAAYDESSLRARIQALMGDDIRIETASLSEEYSAQLTYPVWRIVYETGQEEDTLLCNDLYFQTDAGEYLLHTRTPADHALGFRDELEDYDERIAALFASARLEEVSP